MTKKKSRKTASRTTSKCESVDIYAPTKNAEKLTKLIEKNTSWKKYFIESDSETTKYGKETFWSYDNVPCATTCNMIKFFNKPSCRNLSLKIVIYP